MAELAAHDAANGGVASDEEYSDESERDDDDDEQEEVAEGAAGAEVAAGSAVAGLPDVGELRIAEPAGEEDDSEEEEDDSEDEEDDNEEDGSEEEQSDEEEEEEEGDRRAKKERAPRIGRRPVRSGQRDVEAIVTASLTRSKAQQDRRHHGKKPVSANVLGRQKGSKKKQNANAREARAASKQGGGRGGDFW